MKYFMHDKEVVGGATDAKRYLKRHPEVQSLERYWWSRGDLIECEDFSREQILGKTVHNLESGATAQWAVDHNAAPVPKGNNDSSTLDYWKEKEGKCLACNAEISVEDQYCPTHAQELSEMIDDSSVRSSADQ